MKQYLDLLQKIVTTGAKKEDRTGVGTLSLFGEQLRFDLSQGFPLLTTKKLHFKSIVCELLWILSGSTNNNDLLKDGVTIWSEWADEDGSLGKIYGYQIRHWKDQISELVKNLKERPDSRRHVVSAWNVADLPDESLSPQENVKLGRMCLAPCHCLFQFYVADGRLSCHLYQRSGDCFLGIPYNIAGYSLLTLMLAQQLDLKVGELIISFGDVHIYNSHLTRNIVYEQLVRKPSTLPDLVIKRKPESIFDYKYEDFQLVGYKPYPAIKAPIAV